MKTSKKFYGWKMVGVLWVQYFLNMGLPLYGGAVIGSVMLSTGVISRGVHGTAFGLLYLFMGIAALIIPLSIKKWGVRITFMIGSSLLAFGSLFLSFGASRPWHFLLALGAITGLGIGFATAIPLSTAIARWFVVMRGRAMSITLTASAVAGMVSAPFITALIYNVGISWRQAWLIVAAAMVFAVVLAFLFIKENPSDLGQEPDGGLVETAAKKSREGLRTELEWTPKQAYKTSAFWIILFSACVMQFPFSFFSTHWIPFMTGLQFSPATAAIAMSIFTVVSLPGRLVGGFLVDRIKVKYVFMTGFFFYAITFVLALTIKSQSLVTAYTAAVLMAFGFGLAYVASMTVTMQFFGLKPFPRLSSILVFIANAVGCLGPLAAGFLVQSSGAYSYPFIINIVLSISGFVLVFFLKVPDRKKNSNLDLIHS